MPLTEFQARVLRAIAASRNPDSFFAGGEVIDLFHGRTERLAAAVEADSTALAAAGIVLKWQVTTQPSTAP